MEIPKEKAMEIAQKQVPEGMKIVRVGNLDECWEGHENMKYYQKNQSLCVWRIDDAEFIDSDIPQWSKTKDVLTNEKKEFFYAVADYVEAD